MKRQQIQESLKKQIFFNGAAEITIVSNDQFNTQISHKSDNIDELMVEVDFALNTDQLVIY